MSEIKATSIPNLEGRVRKAGVSHGRTVVAMMEKYWMENLMVREHISGQMETSMLEHGKMASEKG